MRTLNLAATWAAVTLCVAGYTPSMAAIDAPNTYYTALVMQDAVPLRAAPRDSALQQAQLGAGEMVEVRGERLDYLQVYDYQRERGGFVRASQLRRHATTDAHAPELLSALRVVRDTSGSETLGIGLAAAYFKAASASTLNGAPGVDALDALGGFAERLARRASLGLPQSKSQEISLSNQLDLAAHYGVHFSSFERAGQMQLCYDGEAYRRVLALPAQPEQHARAALAVTRTECLDPALRPQGRQRTDEWRADVLDRVDAAALPAYLKNRVLMRRAEIWSSLAYQHTRLGDAADLSARSAAAMAAAKRALAELALVAPSELTEGDVALYNNAAMRTNATRWAALPTMVAPASPNKVPQLVLSAGEPGETCVSLVQAPGDAQHALAKRCTYSLVWANSASINREGNALALAVQPMDGWRELWVFRKDADGWHTNILPPSSTNPELGYAEFAGWVPGGAQMLVARESRSEGKYKHSFELLRLDTLSTERQTSDPSTMGVFQRWQDPSWKRMTVSVR